MDSNELYNELKQLARLGYLEQAQLDRIEAEYLINRKGHRNTFLLFALLGVAFIGAGILSLFAWNWSIYSREMKAVIAFLPLLGVQGLLYRKIHTLASDVWIKSLTLALGIAFLSALGLIYQAYQISFSLQSMLLTGFVIMLPIIYLLDGYYLAFLYMAGICWTGGGGDYILLVFLLFPYYVKRIRSNKSSGLLSLVLLAALLAAALGRLYLSCRKKPAREQSGLLLSAALCGLLAFDLLLYHWMHIRMFTLAYELLVNLCFIAFSLYRLHRGAKTADLPSVRRCTTALILYIILKVCLGNYHLLVKGVVFLMAGLALLIVNYRMSLKLKKGGKNHENTQE